MRLATYNIRNVRAVDPASWWWRRRRRLARVLRRLDADVVGLQEAYPSQIRWLAREAFGGDAVISGVGRNRNGGGEAVPVIHRPSVFTRTDTTTRWFGGSPQVAGSRMPGAPFPRIATTVLGNHVSGVPLTFVNLHLDSDSVERRTTSLEQLGDWLDEDRSGATVVMGDFNGPLDEPGVVALVEAGFRSALAPGTGPTSNGFGRHADRQGQIDHVLVRGDVEVRASTIDTAAGLASDHYPVVVELAIGGAG